MLCFTTYFFCCHAHTFHLSLSCDLLHCIWPTYQLDKKLPYLWLLAYPATYLTSTYLIFLSHSTTEKHIRTVYGICGISETTGASSDVYCQSYNDNDSWTSCAFYVKSIQVKHSGDSGREHRERTRYCRLEREGENRASERIWLKSYIKDSYFGFGR
jgi:hypothetical protein